MSNFLRRDPDVVGTSQVDLIDRAMFLAPVGKFDEAVLLGYVWYRAEDGVACEI